MIIYVPHPYHFLNPGIFAVNARNVVIQGAKANIPGVNGSATPRQDLQSPMHYKDSRGKLTPVIMCLYLPFIYFFLCGR
jgi:hypothetical protein